MLKKNQLELKCKTPISDLDHKVPGIQKLSKASFAKVIYRFEINLNLN